MEQVLTLAIGGALVILGLVGCVVPVLPGPILAYCALWVPVVFGYGLSVSTLLTGACIAAGATAFDYVFPAVCARRFRCTKRGVVGCMLGTAIGLFFIPLGLVLGPFLGTVAGELTAGRNVPEAMRGGVGALLGFVAGTLAKLVAVGALGWMFFKGC